mmetsp:Transcript_26807/g.39808  ORF Transcript_26807/g.39808 Transcript_26807/m.39808 type:complete len:569 (-) Transcript_26807:493-2199(-)
MAESNEAQPRTRLLRRFAYITIVIFIIIYAAVSNVLINKRMLKEVSENVPNDYLRSSSDSLRGLVSADDKTASPDDENELVLADDKTASPDGENELVSAVDKTASPDEENKLVSADDKTASPDGENNNDSSDKKLNILLFYADDWRFDSLGYLNPEVHTPVLDKLTTEGMVFTENAVTTSICWISRACLATGQHYARHQTIDLSSPVPFHKYWDETLFAKLKDNGYVTGMVGKWQPGIVKEHMFSHANSYYGFHYSGEDHITDMNERDALDFLRNKRGNGDEPFALFVNFFAPHHKDGSKEQYFPQKTTEHLYNDKNITFGPTCTEEAWEKMPPFFTDFNDGRVRWRDRFNEPSKAQMMIKNYFRLISGVDMACGKIIEELEKQNLIDDTLIVFTTDNGYYLGEHGLADKWYAHQESIKVPLIIKDPRMNKNLIGTRNDEFTLSIDLAPTMLQAAGIDIPDRMQGTDMSQLYQFKDSGANANEAWRRSFYYEYPGISGHTGHIPVQALVQKDFKYIYWPGEDFEELFHLPTDHYEERDLARNGTMNETIAVILEDLRDTFKKAREAAF